MPSDFLILQYLPYVLPLALPALWLLRCLVSALLGRGLNGGCLGCVALTAFGFALWPEVAPFFGIDGPWRTLGLPEDIGLRLLITGFSLLAVGLLLYLVPSLRHRRDPDDELEELLDALEEIGLDGGDAGDGRP